MLISGFKATSIWKAFFLNSLILAIVAVGAVESKAYVEKLGWFEDQDEVVKALGTFLITFFVGVFSYLLMYSIFGFGGGMLVDVKT
jgi:hypothetical protein